jgi:hypothetical protein
MHSDYIISLSRSLIMTSLEGMNIHVIQTIRRNIRGNTKQFDRMNVAHALPHRWVYAFMDYQNKGSGSTFMYYIIMVHITCIALPVLRSFYLSIIYHCFDLLVL